MHRASRRLGGWVAWGVAGVLLAGCATTQAPGVGSAKGDVHESQPAGDDVREVRPTDDDAREARGADARDPDADPDAHDSDADPDDVAAPGGADARRRAAEARVEAERAGERVPRLFDSAELRVSERPEDDILAGEGTRLALQLNLRSPWEAAAERRARQAATREADARLDSATLEARVEACVSGVELAAHAEREAAFARYATEVHQLLDWVASLREASVLDDVRAARLEVEAQTRLASREPGPPPWHAAANGALPDLEPRDASLEVVPDRVREIIAAHHPDPQSRHAAARRLAAEAESQRAATYPWLRRVRVSYDLPHGRRAEGFGGQVALRFPFGTEERGQTARLRALARAEDWEAQSRVADHGRIAMTALAELSRFEARTERWQALIDLAERSEQLAHRWLEAEQGEASAIADLLADAHGAREAAIAARERAGLAACTLLASTGVTWARWPREEPSR